MDRHGKRRWRFRRAGKTTQLPGEPGELTFESAYRACIEGRTSTPRPASARSLRAAWIILTTKTPEWWAMAATTRRQQTRIAERFLTTVVAPGIVMGDIAMADLERRHIKALLAARSNRPHAANHLLRLIRKLTGIGLDQEWITVDPCYRVSLRPELAGWKAWKDESLAAFELRFSLPNPVESVRSDMHASSKDLNQHPPLSVDFDIAEAAHRKFSAFLKLVSQGAFFCSLRASHVFLGVSLFSND
jgi:hypothetical protein